MGSAGPWWKRRWVLVAGAVLAVLVAIGARSNGEEQVEAAPAATTTIVTNTTPREAAEAAVGETELSFLTHRQLVDLVAESCSAMEGPSTSKVADLIVEALDGQIGALTAARVREAAAALAEVVPKACPTGVIAHPNLVNVLVALAPTTTTKTTSAPPTTTTTPPTTTVPPTTAPPATQPPAPSPEQEPEPAPNDSGPYANCTEARAAGVTPLHRGDPGYASKMDGDGDGIACE